MRWMLAFILTLLGLSLAVACGADEERSVDFSESGPFDVGVAFFMLPDSRPVDVYYPAASGTGEIADPFVHNLNDPWPDSIRENVPRAPNIVVDAYPDVQSSGDGPFPVILESHGFGSSRRDGSLNHRHLASWGFIVVAPEHFERNRATVTGQPPEFELMESVEVLSAALDLVLLESLAPGSVLEGTVDEERIAVDGVSAGGAAALDMAGDPRVSVVIGRAPGEPEGEVSGAPVMLLAADRDVAVELDEVRALFAGLDAPKGLAVILNAGHNTFTDACAIIRAEGGLDIPAFVEATGFPAELLEFGNNGCTEEYVDPALVHPVINHLQVAYIRWALGIDNDEEALSPDFVEATFPDVLSDYQFEQ